MRIIHKSKWGCLGVNMYKKIFIYGYSKKTAKEKKEHDVGITVHNVDQTLNSAMAANLIKLLYDYCEKVTIEPSM
jgi:hypothetical protein